jgi:UDP-N-acetylglucosamine--N-acetylmuramyl-(pentapeptide) pyrophosphoryl-undecaprenol N-acetylglucosamine transferase
MAGGGTGGHVIPALAVAAELRLRGHEPVFVGTRTGLEARLVPSAGYPIEWIEVRGLKRTGLLNSILALAQLPAAVFRALSLLRSLKPAAVFSMGGFVAGPVVLACAIKRIPMVAMEPNAMPGLVSRRMARWYRKALVSFPEAVRFFPPDVAEVAGLPVREAFFQIPSRPPADPLTVLVTGGSRGARALNRAAAEAFPLFREAGSPVRWIVQTGAAGLEDASRVFHDAGLPGRVVAFLEDMPAAFAEADLVVGRSGAGAVAELAAAGKPSILVPFPFAADDHQARNAEAMQRAGAARMVPESEFSGRRLFELVEELRRSPQQLVAMSEAARRAAKAGAARRAADCLEEVALKR